ncbi:MAG: hypothetical protein PHT15_01895 [Gallionellaceae bacterium]|nr:hypothetical protein [Gallionellaceae bacterium]
MEAAKQGITANVHKAQISGARMVLIGVIAATVLYMAWGIIKMIL